MAEYDQRPWLEAGVLKPCPFCGNAKPIMDRMEYHFVYCPKCGACGPNDLGQSGAMEAWNTRPLEDSHD